MKCKIMQLRSVTLSGAVLMTLLGMVIMIGCMEEQLPTHPGDTEAVQLEADDWGEGEELVLDKRRYRSKKVKAMTWNVYVGGDVDVVLAAPPEEIPFKVAEAYQTLLATNFAERAEEMAHQIRRKRPDVIGLQEISTIYRQSPGDFFSPDGNTVPGEADIQFDYLQIFMDALHRKGLRYRVAGIVKNTDVEVPMFTGVLPTGDPTFDDVRLVDYDVLLVRKGVKVNNLVEANYNASLVIPGFVEVLRGYVAIDATICGETYRVVTTHLESEDGYGIRDAQAVELMQQLPTDMPVILMGDFNTHANLVPAPPTYALLTGGTNPFQDIWLLNRRPDPENPEGFTAPHDADLRNTTIKLSHRIDLILFRPGDRNPADINIGVRARVIGDRFRDLTRSGMWPSDHAGVAARLEIPFKNKKH